jgi:hypothetical protein
MSFNVAVNTRSNGGTVFIAALKTREEAERVVIEALRRKAFRHGPFSCILGVGCAISVIDTESNASPAVLDAQTPFYVLVGVSDNGVTLNAKSAEAASDIITHAIDRGFVEHEISLSEKVYICVGPETTFMIMSAEEMRNAKSLAQKMAAAEAAQRAIPDVPKKIILS